MLTGVQFDVDLAVGYCGYVAAASQRFPAWTAESSAANLRRRAVMHDAFARSMAKAAAQGFELLEGLYR